MKRLIQSPLFVGLLAVVLFFGVQAYLIEGLRMLGEGLTQTRPVRSK